MKPQRKGQKSLLQFFAPANKKPRQEEQSQQSTVAQIDDAQPSMSFGTFSENVPTTAEECSLVEPIQQQPEDGQIDTQPSMSFGTFSENVPTTAEECFLAEPINARDPCNDVLSAKNSINAGPFQPILDFPAKNGRKFRPKWYTSYPWLEYSPSNDGAYCFVCRVFYQSQGDMSKADDAFTINGFCNWKKANQAFKNHEKCHVHVSNAVKLTSFKQSQKHGTVMEKLDSQYSKTVKENRQYLYAVVQSIIYCGRQGQALRGHQENEDSKNKGNFLELMELRSCDNEIIKRMLCQRERNYKYIAPRFQNQLLQLIGNQIMNEISCQVKRNKFFALMADETQDIAKHEQVAIVLRHVDENLRVHESFVGFYRTVKTDGESLANLLQSVLTSMDLDIQNLGAQCYDGASSMRGPYKGVASRLLEVNPKAMYIHCYAHILNLCIVSFCTSVSEIRNAFFDLQCLYNFIERSYKRHAIFEKIQKSMCSFYGGTKTLKSLSDTRWYCRVEAVRSLLDNFDATIMALNEIAETDPSVGGEANSLVKRMEDFHFIFCLVFLMRVLSQCDILSRTLQSSSINFAAVNEVAQSTVEVLKSFRSDSFFKQLWDFSKQIAEKCGFKPASLPRVKNVPKKFGGGTKNYFLCAEDFYRIEIVYAVVDTLIEELTSRFEENNLNILQKLSSIVTANTVDLNAVSEICNFYKLPENQTVAELSCLHNMESMKNKSFDERCSQLVEKNHKEAFPVVFNLFRLLLTVPASSASCERSFSCLRRLKTYTRNTTGQDRLSSLALMAIEREINIDIEKVIDDFSLGENRRVHFK